EKPHQPGDLRKCQEFLACEKLKVTTEHFLRHAIGAAKVAAVGHRDTKIAKRPAKGINNTHRTILPVGTRPRHEYSTQSLIGAAGSYHNVVIEACPPDRFLELCSVVNRYELARSTPTGRKDLNDVAANLVIEIGAELQLADALLEDLARQSHLKILPLKFA